MDAMERAPESFRSRMQVELLDRKRWRTRLELANATFEYPRPSTTASAVTQRLAHVRPVEFYSA